MGLCHHSFTVKLKCHVFFGAICIILHTMVKYTWPIVPVYLFSVRRLRTERFTKTVEREHGHLSNEKKRKIYFL